MDLAQLAITFAVGLAGVALGAWLSRRNEKHAHGERLLVAALSDAVEAVADVAAGEEQAQRRYAGALARIALYASPQVIGALREFQNDATTLTRDGRERFVTAVQTVRRDLKLRSADREDITVLLFGSSRRL